MTVVLDIGAADWGTETSIRKLIDRFQPDTLFAYDANPVFGEGIWQEGRTVVIQRRQAVWTYGGLVRFHGGGTRGYVDNAVESQPGTTVECVDIAEIVKDYCATRDIIIKADCEGGEWTLLPHLVATGMDECVQLLLVERHGGTDNEWEALLGTLRCPVEEWQ